MARTTRKEIDSLGEVDVPEGAYYGAQTARSLVNFDIGSDIMPRPMIRAFGLQNRLLQGLMLNWEIWMKNWEF